jgi:hypothetical protein
MRTYEENFWCVAPRRGARAPRVDKKYNEQNLLVDSGTKEFVIF